MITVDDCPEYLRDAPNGRALLKAWNGWRGLELTPDLPSVRPEHIGAALSSILLFEVLAPEMIVIRLAGTRHEETLGRDITGENFVDLAAPNERGDRIESFQNYVSFPCGAIWTTDVVRSRGERINVRALALPVKPEAPNGPVRVYAAYDFSGRVTGVETESMHILPIAAERLYVDIGFGAPE